DPNDRDLAMSTPSLFSALALSCLLMSTPALDAGQIVVAHRGASGYLPEHTFAAKVLAHAQGADYLEQDVCLTRDNIPIVIHDIHLEGTTDVAARFPGRARADGHFYALDFTLEEIRQLDAHERVNAAGKPVFPTRFGLGEPRFEVHTLDEEIELIQRLNRECGRNAGLYVEIKRPAFHAREGRDITRIVIECLSRHGYTSRESNCWIQCFDSTALKRLRGEFACELRLTQLVSDNSKGEDSQDDYAAMRTPAGLDEVARYADAIGPSITQIVRLNEAGMPTVTGLVADAHAAGLSVCPYTLRRDNLPANVTEDAMLDLLFTRAGVDGLFTDFPDSAVAYLRQECLRSSADAAPSDGTPTPAPDITADEGRERSH
ncbi:MAG TPA: glycerophosphodiester phosphodiesterase, partial [Opitutales bacterium]|nr:glycerophosphodiester phosphodiesterase [Opitutales bacterium]